MIENNIDFPCKFVYENDLWVPPPRSAEVIPAAQGLGLEFETKAGPWPDYKPRNKPEPTYEELVKSWNDTMESIRAEINRKPS